jgi:hypothetical protein
VHVGCYGSIEKYAVGWLSGYESIKKHVVGWLSGYEGIVFAE